MAPLAEGAGARSGSGSPLFLCLSTEPSIGKPRNVGTRNAS